MADKIYAIANEVATADRALIRTLNGGSSWELVRSQLITYARQSATLREFGGKIYYAICIAEGVGHGSPSRIGMYDPATDTNYYINCQNVFGWPSDWYVCDMHISDESNIWMSVWDNNTSKYDYARLTHFNGNWASPQSSDYTYLGISYQETGGRSYPMEFVSSSEIYIGYVWNHYGWIEPCSCLLKWDGTPASRMIKDSSLSAYDACYGVRKHPTDGYLYILVKHDSTDNFKLLRGQYGGPWTELYNRNYGTYRASKGETQNMLFIAPNGYVCWAMQIGPSNMDPYFFWWDGSSIHTQILSDANDNYPWMPRVSGLNFNDLAANYIGYYGRDWFSWNGSVWTGHDMGSDFNTADDILVVGDSTDPVIQNRDPADSETDVAADSNFQFEVVDPDTGIEASTVIIQVKHGAAGSWIDVWTGDAAQSGYSVAKTTIADGFRYEVNPDANFPYETEIFVRVYAENADGGSVDETVSFTTEDYPFKVFGIDADSVPKNGGMELTATGEFPTDQAMKVFFGTAQDQTDAPCYGGQGYGYEPLSLDGTTLTFVTPPVDFVGASFYATFFHEPSGYAYSEGPLSVVESGDNYKLTSFKRSMVGWMKLNG